jgi:uncharacterized membrane protein
MVTLAGLLMLRLPLWAVTAIGVIMIAGHNLLDGVRAEEFGSLRWVWIILHQPAIIDFSRGRQLDALYSLMPWVGVMMTGYGLGSLLLYSPSTRQKWLLGLGLSLILAFTALRGSNLYGDPLLWIHRSSPSLTFLSFINTNKYPPSLLFLLMTLGPALLLLAVFNRVTTDNPFARLLTVFGRVPLFYYVLHLNLIHAVAVVFSYIHYRDASWLIGTDWMFRLRLPRNYGYELPVVYLVWIGVVILLYPVRFWFARLKQRSRMWWLSYF